MSCAVIHSCVHGQLRGRALISFTNNYFLYRIQVRGYGSVLSLSLVVSLSLIQVGNTVLGNVDTDKVCILCFIHKQRSLLLSSFFQGMPLKWIQEYPK